MHGKTCTDFRDAVADIPDGATVAFAGFAMPGTPFNLIRALAEHGARNLTCIANTTGGAQQPRMPDIGMLVERGQVRKVICAFTAATRASDVLPFTRYHEAGEVEAELVPQGTLAERLRAAGAGIPAFYTPTAVGTELAEGRETRSSTAANTCWNMRCRSITPSCVPPVPTARQPALPSFPTNFNPVMAMAARVAIVEVEENPARSAIDPDQVHTPTYSSTAWSRCRPRRTDLAHAPTGAQTTAAGWQLLDLLGGGRRRVPLPRRFRLGRYPDRQRGSSASGPGTVALAAVAVRQERL